MHAIAACLLGLVQRTIRDPDQLVGMGGVLGHAGAADRDGDRDDGAVDHDRIAADNPAASLGQLRQAVLGHSGRQHTELFAAQPSERVGGAEAPGQPPCDLDQDAVAERMTVPVVHDLEMVDVDHQQADRHPHLRGVARGPSEMSLERTAVGHAGEGIGLCQRVHPCGEPAPVADRQVQPREQHPEPAEHRECPDRRLPQDGRVRDGGDDEPGHDRRADPGARRPRRRPAAVLDPEERRSASSDRHGPAGLPARIEPASVLDALQADGVGISEPGGGPG